MHCCLPAINYECIAGGKNENAQKFREPFGSLFPLVRSGKWCNNNRVALDASMLHAHMHFQNPVNLKLNKCFMCTQLFEFCVLVIVCMPIMILYLPCLFITRTIATSKKVGTTVDYLERDETTHVE